MRNRFKNAVCVQVSLAPLKSPALHTSLVSYYSPSPFLLTARLYRPMSLFGTRPISPQKKSTW